MIFRFLDWASLWFLYFIIYSFFGWVFESCFCSIKAKPPHWINRGVLFGPICPIYGCGAILIAKILENHADMPWYWIFVISLVVCSAIEYFTSWALEKLFHVRWWSYKNSNHNLTLNGRISIGTSVGFGVGGVILMKKIHPCVAPIVTSWSFGIRMALTVALVILLIIDEYMSSNALSSVKHALKGGKVDLTEEIKKYAFNYYHKQTRRTRHAGQIILRRMKKAQKRAVKSLKATQRQLKNAAKRAKDRQNMRQKKLEGKMTLRKQKLANKREFRAKKLETRVEVARKNLQTIPKKTEKMLKNAREFVSPVKDDAKSKNAPAAKTKSAKTHSNKKK